MRLIRHLCTLFFLIVLFSGCSKQDMPLTEEQKVVNNLTGIGNRYWHLKNLYINNAEQMRTADQMRYTKTYTITESTSGTFTNSDGYAGTWELRGTMNLIEMITNIPTGPVTIMYQVDEITDNKLSITYKTNSIPVKEVYYAY